MHASSVGLSQTSPAPEPDPAFSPSSGPRTMWVHALYVRTKETVFLLLYPEEKKEADCIIFYRYTLIVLFNDHDHFPVVHGFPQAVYDVDEDDTMDTEFALNVVGTTQLPALVVSGTVTAHTDGTAQWQPRPQSLPHRTTAYSS